MERAKYADPSFVMVGFNRFDTTPGVSLFGSSVRHRSGINLTIKEGELHRELSHDWYFARKTLIEVTLSPNQFATLLTSMNVGDGTPATLNYCMGKEYSYPDNIPTQAEQFDNELNEGLSDVIDNLNKAQEKAKALLEKATPLRKDERKELLSQIEGIKRWTQDHLPFIMETVHKSIQKSVVEAKGDIDSFVTNVVMKTGLDELLGRKPELTFQKEEPRILDINGIELEPDMIDQINLGMEPPVEYESDDVIDSHITGDRSEV